MCKNKVTNITLCGNKLKRVREFSYLRGTLTEDGKSKTKIVKRILKQREVSTVKGSGNTKH